MSGKRTLIEIAAYHEAGHAVAALREGRPVSWVATFRHKPGNGICYFKRRQKNPFNPSIDPDCALASWVYTMESARSSMRIGLAGPLAEARVLGKPLRALGSKSDLAKCLNLASRLRHLHSYISEFTPTPPFNSEQFLDTERLFVRHWLGQPKVWNAVESVANRLFRFGQISNQFVDEAVGNSYLSYYQPGLVFRKQLGQKRVL